MTMFQMGQISPQLALKVLLQFDKAINTALAQRVKAKITFKVRNPFFLLSLSVTSKKTEFENPFTARRVLLRKFS